MTRLHTIDEVSDRPHYWRRDRRGTFDWFNARDIRKVENALSTARRSLERDARGESRRFDTLRDAMDHALMAWCLVNSELDESGPQQSLRILRQRPRGIGGEGRAGRALSLVAQGADWGTSGRNRNGAWRGHCAYRIRPSSTRQSEASSQEYATLVHCLGYLRAIPSRKLGPHGSLPAGSDRGGCAPLSVRPARVLW